MPVIPLIADADTPTVTMLDTTTVATGSHCCCDCWVLSNNIPDFVTYHTVSTCGPEPCANGPWSTTIGPFEEDVFCQLLFRGVDDDVSVNGVILEEGEHPFTDSGGTPCPGSGVSNGLHDCAGINFWIYVGQQVDIEVTNNFRGQCGLGGGSHAEFWMNPHPCDPENFSCGGVCQTRSDLNDQVNFILS